MEAEYPVKKLMEFIPENEAVSICQLTCRTGLNYRTVRRYLNLIMEIQKAQKIVPEHIGVRMVVKKEREKQDYP